jgi:hypothetical protein
MIPAEVAEHIHKAGESNGEAAGKLGEAAEGKAGGSKPGADLDQAEAEIDKALAALKKMMMKGMGPGDMPGDDGEGQGQGKGKGPGKDGKGQGEGNAPGGKGKAKRGKNTPSGIKPVEATERDSQWEALMLLEKEKAPAEYEQMVDQYIRNLGKGELPSR